MIPTWLHGLVRRRAPRLGAAAVAVALLAPMAARPVGVLGEL